MGPISFQNILTQQFVADLSSYNKNTTNVMFPTHNIRMFLDILSPVTL